MHLGSMFCKGGRATVSEDVGIIEGSTVPSPVSIQPTGQTTQDEDGDSPDPRSGEAGEEGGSTVTAPPPLFAEAAGQAAGQRYAKTTSAACQRRRRAFARGQPQEPGCERMNAGVFPKTLRSYGRLIPAPGDRTPATALTRYRAPPPAGYLSTAFGAPKFLTRLGARKSPSGNDNYGE